MKINRGKNYNEYNPKYEGVQNFTVAPQSSSGKRRGVPRSYTIKKSKELTAKLNKLLNRSKE